MQTVCGDRRRATRCNMINARVASAGHNASTVRAHIKYETLTKCEFICADAVVVVVVVVDVAERFGNTNANEMTLHLVFACICVYVRWNGAFVFVFIVVRFLGKIRFLAHTNINMLSMFHLAAH